MRRLKRRVKLQMPKKDELALDHALPQSLVQLSHTQRRLLRVHEPIAHVDDISELPWALACLCREVQRSHAQQLRRQSLRDGDLLLSDFFLSSMTHSGFNASIPLP